MKVNLWLSSGEHKFQGPQWKETYSNFLNADGTNLDEDTFWNHDFAIPFGLERNYVEIAPWPCSTDQDKNRCIENG